MTLLCVDVGNSQTVLGLFAGEEITHHWRVGTDGRRTADEWAVVFSGLLGDLVSGIEGIALCSTVPVVLHEMREMLARHYHSVRSTVVEPGVRTGVRVLMDNPREVGTDRICNALAASRLHPGPSIVVDLGTATTFDVVSARGEYVGGAIAPGIEISLDALGERGAQLRRVELLRPRAIVAKNTVEALQAGAVYGFAAQIDGLVARMVEELGWSSADVNVIVTGGLAPFALEECRTPLVHEPWLTLIGLRLAYQRNL
ncbi:MAG TPA: type III pantothenate kinase [Nocardioidaceae bacterium]|nr:type III pantothenate kinase [Nocardioidaceae bacterium]